MNKRLQRARKRHEKWLLKHGIDPKIKTLRQLRGFPFPDLSVKSEAQATSAYPIEHTGSEQPQKRETFTSNLQVGQSHKQSYMHWIVGFDLPEHMGGKKT